MATALTSRRTEPATRWLDRLGIGVSAFCLLQCLALPVVLLLAPTLAAGFLSHEVFHLLLFAIILPVSGLAFTLGYLRHRDARIWIPAVVGLAFLLVAIWLEHEHALPPLGIAAVTSVGGVLLILAHLKNLRCRSAVHR